MKKKIIMTILGLGAGMLLFAAGSRDTVITIEGKLAVSKGVPTIVSGEKTWVLPAAPFYQIAWENGIKVGDAIKAEGTVMDDRGAPEKSADSMFIPTKVWVNGKAVDLSTVSVMMEPPAGRPGKAPCMDAGRDGTQDRQRPGDAGNSADR